MIFLYVAAIIVVFLAAYVMVYHRKFPVLSYWRLLLFFLFPPLAWQGALMNLFCQRPHLRIIAGCVTVYLFLCMAGIMGSAVGIGNQYVRFVLLAGYWFIVPLASLVTGRALRT